MPPPPLSGLLHPIADFAGEFLGHHSLTFPICIMGPVAITHLTGVLRLKVR